KADGAFVAVRYTPSGEFDPTFGGGDGIAAVLFGSQTEAVSNGMALLPDGKILLAGYASVNARDASSAALVRLNANGSPDTSFGDAGKVLTPPQVAGGARVQDLDVMPDGRFLVGGSLL